MADDKREVEPAADLAPAREPREQEPDEELSIPEEFLDSMPAEERNQFVQLISSITQFGGPVFNPVLRRITSDHITQLIGNDEARSRREAEAEKSGRRYQFTYFIITIAVVLFLVVFFTFQQRTDLITAVLTGIAGLGAGFGLGRMTGRR